MPLLRLTSLKTLLFDLCFPFNIGFKLCSYISNYIISLSNSLSYSLFHFWNRCLHYLLPFHILSSYLKLFYSTYYWDFSRLNHFYIIKTEMILIHNKARSHGKISSFFSSLNKYKYCNIKLLYICLSFIWIDFHDWYPRFIPEYNSNSGVYKNIHVLSDINILLSQVYSHFHSVTFVISLIGWDVWNIVFQSNH